MIYVCKTEHVKTGKSHVFRTVYDFKRGDIIYPWHLQSEYPGHNEKPAPRSGQCAPGQPDGISKDEAVRASISMRDAPNGSDKRAAARILLRLPDGIR